MQDRACKGKNSRSVLNDYTVIDLETTGININQCEVIEMAAAKVRNGEITDKFSTFVKPNNKIPEEITAITGITNDMVIDAPDCTDALKSFLAFVGDDVVVGHNIMTFDVNILYDLSVRYFGQPFSNDMVDTCQFARYCNIKPEDYKLTTLTAYFDIRHESAHRALADCIANQKCYEMMKPLLTSEYRSSGNADRKSFGMRLSDTTKSLQQLTEIVRYIISDDVLSDREIILLNQWLNENQNLAGNYPYDVLYSKITEILEDGMVTEAERDELMSILIEHSDPVQHRSEREDMDFDFSGKKVCLTGEFDAGSRPEMESRFKQAGAIVVSAVSSKVDFVIVGGMGSTQWACGNYGSKVKKALELQNAGKPIKIIREDVAVKCLKCKI